MKPSPKPQVASSVRRPADVSGPFVCSWSAVGACAVVRVAGAIDVGTLPTFANELQHVITTKLPRLVVDLRRVTRMEAAGLDVLADAHDLAVEHGGWLRASGAGQWLGDLLRATRTVRPLDHYPNLADALPSYRPGIASGP
ncbi:STAS domain-containing protein [Kribbella soli]|uniref:Anti-sigma factor antagonist n=1 Tax=Kribbella soli TaxID=1124743 RepID=A0A4R0H6E5_9ACTN|nr:STAS domain-containing protein [Kribbella soli]TCC05493.1 anti-sigma factor antagonist [Kribbella soli]